MRGEEDGLVEKLLRAGWTNERKSRDIAQGPSAGVRVRERERERERVSWIRGAGRG